jgi:phospholipid/cholesterol/gamma-HCH transport system substrate-binding protein
VRVLRKRPVEKEIPSMETKANYVLIGAFTIAGIIGSLGLLLWLAKVEVDRQYAYYDVLFDSVSGLSEAAGVSYNGLPVGQVMSHMINVSTMLVWA